MFTDRALVIVSYLQSDRRSGASTKLPLIWLIQTAQPYKHTIYNVQQQSATQGSNDTAQHTVTQGDNWSIHRQLPHVRRSYFDNPPCYGSPTTDVDLRRRTTVIAGHFVDCYRL